MITAFPIFSIRFKFSIKRLPSLFQDVFYKDKVKSCLNLTVLAIVADNKDIKSKRKFCRQLFA